METAAKSAKDMQTQAGGEVHKMDAHKKISGPGTAVYQKTKNPQKFTPSKKLCFRCGKGPHNPDDCRLKQAECHICHKHGHIAPKGCMIERSLKLTQSTFRLSLVRQSLSLDFSWYDRK